MQSTNPSFTDSPPDYFFTTLGLDPTLLSNGAFLRRMILASYKSSHAFKNFFKDAEKRLPGYSLFAHKPVLVFIATVETGIETRTLQQVQEPATNGRVLSQGNVVPIWALVVKPSSWPAKDTETVKVRRPGTDVLFSCPSRSKRRMLLNSVRRKLNNKSLLLTNAPI